MAAQRAGSFGRTFMFGVAGAAGTSTSPSVFGAGAALGGVAASAAPRTKAVKTMISSFCDRHPRIEQTAIRLSLFPHQEPAAAWPIHIAFARDGETALEVEVQGAGVAFLDLQRQGAVGVEANMVEQG